MNAEKISQPYEAVLLLGPTGSGKTPLGDICQQRGLLGRRCCHFDFGENLRSIDGSGVRSAFLSGDDMAVIRDSLDTGTLLENETFYIAGRILKDFIRKRKLDEGDILLLNGLPRHLGQACDVDEILQVSRVIYLKCDAQTAYRRVVSNAGGDRSGRIDDSLTEIQRKLETFRERTLPLLDHYSDRQIINLAVSQTSTAEQMRQKVELHLSC